MSRPTSLLIAGQPFAIGWVPADGPFMRPERVGETDTAKQRIAISDGLGHDAERDTVVHEALHAILMLTGNDDRFNDNDAREGVVTTLSVGLLALLRHNPGFVDYLTEHAA